MISAYSSRLNKREDVEQLREQVCVRDKQIQTMMSVLEHNLPRDKLSGILSKIRELTASDKLHTV